MQGSDAGLVKNAELSDVTWLGTTTEYAKTLRAFFDKGLRKVAVGTTDKNGNLSQVKYGLMDQNGVWKAQPIYDKIEAQYWNTDNHTATVAETDIEKLTESIFVNGYVQTVKNGKMGLLDHTGKEVIPCNYNAVGLPAEGMCRIISGDYIGYWNLALGKEVVAPNKYKLPGSSYGGAAGDRWHGGGAEIALDYKAGYALVITGKTDTVSIKAYNGVFNKPSTYTVNDRDTKSHKLIYGQIIDKNGKEVLPAAFPFLESGYYPQDGAYLVYTKAAKEMMQMASDTGNDVMFSGHLDSGIVGPKGVLVEAQYHGGISGNGVTGWRLTPANIQIIASAQAFIAPKSAHTGLKEGVSPVGLFNFTNKAIIPLQVAGKGNFVTYKEGYFEAYDGIYRGNGQIIKETGFKQTDIKKGGRATGYVAMNRSRIANGYVLITKEEMTYASGASGDVSKSTLQSAVALKTGKVYPLGVVYGKEHSEVSSAGTIWIKQPSKPGAKWSLINLQGKTVLPFEYEDVKYSDAVYPFTLVKKNGKWGVVDKAGKILLPCTYLKIDLITSEDSAKTYLELTDASKKHGVYSMAEKKITVSPAYGANLGTGSIADTVLASVGDRKYQLVDMTTGQALSEALAFSTDPLRGIYGQTVYAKAMYGPDGKVVLPTGKNSETFSLVVNGDQVGYVNTSALAGK